MSWSHPGALQGSAVTYNSIKAALENHQWPSAMDHRVYLQGSYANRTNIRGDSDVDVVVESSNTFYHNIRDEHFALYGLTTPASYSWRQFRDEVWRALVDHYGSSTVTVGDKSLKVAGKGNRLNADIVPCNAYRQYDAYRAYATGITFWTLAGVQIVNFPKLHLANGSAKNKRCGAQYKPSVRMFKNARNRAENDLPSYFLECLLYNVPDYCFTAQRQDTFVATINYLVDAIGNGSMNSFPCQNEQQTIVGLEQHQIALADAMEFLNAMVNL